MGAFWHTSKTRCKQASQFDGLLDQKSNSNLGTRRELRWRVRNQLRNTHTGLNQQLRQHHRWKEINDANRPNNKFAPYEPPIKRDTCRCYKRATPNKTTAVRCYQLKVHYVILTQIPVTQITIKIEEIDIKTVESIERGDPSEETLALTKRWREIANSRDYWFTQGQWKWYNPQEHWKPNKRKLK